MGSEADTAILHGNRNLDASEASITNGSTRGGQLMRDDLTRDDIERGVQDLQPDERRRIHQARSDQPKNSSYPGAGSVGGGVGMAM